MSKIIQIEEDKVLLGTEDNKIVEVPIEQLNFDENGERSGGDRNKNICLVRLGQLIWREIKGWRT